MAVAAGTSPMSLPQSSSGLFDVIRVLFNSCRRMMISKRYSPDRFGRCFSVRWQSALYCKIRWVLKKRPGAKSRSIVFASVEEQVEVNRVWIHVWHRRLG